MIDMEILPFPPSPGPPASCWARCWARCWLLAAGSHRNRGYITARTRPGPGPEITRGYILIISGVWHDFLDRFFALISNFLSGGSYLPGNDCFEKSSSKNYENLNLSSPDRSEQKRKNRFFSIFYINFRFLYIFPIFHHFDPMEPCFDLSDG